MFRMTLISLSVLAAFATTAAAQQEQQTATSTIRLPDACQKLADAGMAGRDMSSMMGDMSSMQKRMDQMMAGASETQKGLHQAMMQMGPEMMKGMMAKDADVAWICTMIPHHQGAIAMARAGLEGADNEQSRKMAEETIKMQEEEIQKLTAWVEKNAESESKDESTGTTPAAQ